MRTIYKTSGYALAMATVCGLAVYYTGDLALYPPLEWNRIVNTCAAHLGKTAVNTARIPSACHDLADEFNYKETVVTFYNAQQQEGVTSEDQKLYVLPPAKDFIKDQSITPQQVRQNENARNCFSLIAAGIGLLFGGVVAYELIKQQKSR